MSTDASNADISSFKTGSKYHQFTYTWTIENLAFWAKKADEYLETDVFRPRLIDDGIWRLRLYPRGRDETLLWYLERICGERAETVFLNFKITISSGTVVHYEYHSNNYPFRKGSGAVSATEKKLKDILGQDSMLRDQEALTIVCQMSRKCSAVALSEKLSSCTRIEIGRLTFSWHFGQFSKWNPAEQYTYAGYTYGNAVYDILSCKMHLYTVRDPVDYRIGIIIRFRRPPTEDFLVAAKISVLNADGRPVYSFNGTYFEKSGDDTIVWVTPAFIDKNSLAEEADVFLPNDELTLLTEFNIPVRNIYAVRLHYSLAPSATLQYLEQTSKNLCGKSSSVSTQTIHDLALAENATQTETEIRMVEQEKCSNDKCPRLYVFSPEKSHLVLEALQNSSAPTFCVVHNGADSSEEDILLNFDSDDFKESGTSDVCAYYQENGTLEFDSQKIYDSEISRDSQESDVSEDEKDTDLVDPTQPTEVNSYCEDPSSENAKFEKETEPENFTKEQSASTEDIYEEDLTSEEEEEEEDSDDASEDASNSDDSDDSEDDLTSEEDSDASTDASTSGDDSEKTSDDTAISEEHDSDYCVRVVGSARQSRRRNRSEASTSNQTHETSTGHTAESFRTRFDQLNDHYSGAFKWYVVVYVVAMFLYFFANDAGTYPRKNPSPFFSYRGNTEFMKQLSLLYAEALDDPPTLELVRSYSSSHVYNSAGLMSKMPYPVSNLCVANAWVVLALADSHQDNELMGTVLDFLDANKDVTFDSRDWRNEMEARMKKAHDAFRQRFGKKALKKNTDV